MEEFLDKNTTENRIDLPHKPNNMLRLLCILTFIWSGLGVLQNLTYTLFLDQFKEIIPGMTLPADYNLVKQAVLKLLSAGRLFFILGLVLNISSIYGAAMMLKMNKKGFHFYAIAQMIMLMLPMIFIKDFGFSAGDLLLTTTFIAMYAIQTKEMRAV